MRHNQMTGINMKTNGKSKALNSVSVKPINGFVDLYRFIHFPWKHYKNDRNWVPPLILDIKSRLNRKKNSFFKHGDAELFIAERNGRSVGRISASVDTLHNRTSGDKTGFFGFFECEDNPKTAGLLIDAASEWLQNRGCDKVRGPCSFTLEDPYVGVLVKGHDRKPYFLMSYTKPYYDQLLGELNFQKAQDLNAYEMIKEWGLPSEFEEKSNAAQNIEGFSIRHADLSEVEREAEIIRNIFNEALSDNWGYVPFTEAQVKKMVSELKLIVDPRMVLIAEVKGDPVGVLINLPNLNEALEKMNGRLFPTGIFKLIYYKKRIKSVRAYALGIAKQYQNKGVGTAMIVETYRRGTGYGYEKGELTWILEDNERMNALAEHVGAKHHKLYRIYEKEI